LVCYYLNIGGYCSCYEIKKEKQMTTIPQQWAERALYDLDTAKAMLDSGRYLYVLFCCQQSIEKQLKAIIAERTQEFPPRIHQLVRLAEKASLELTEDQTKFLRKLSSYYIQTRYPEDIADIGKGVDLNLAKMYYEGTKEVFEWLSSLI